MIIPAFFCWGWVGGRLGVGRIITVPVSAKDQLCEPFVLWVIDLFEKTYKFHKMPMFLFILMRFEAGVGSDF